MRLAMLCSALLSSNILLILARLFAFCSTSSPCFCALTMHRQR